MYHLLFDLIDVGVVIPPRCGRDIVVVSLIDVASRRQELSILLRDGFGGCELRSWQRERK